MIDLADTTFRAYKMRRGSISLHLRSYLIVHTDASFSLTAYLKDIKCWLTLPGRSEQELDSVSVSEAVVCKFDGHTMLYDMRASTVVRGVPVKPCVADFRMMYHLSFTGHPTEKPEFLQRKVPVIPRFY